MSDTKNSKLTGVSQTLRSNMTKEEKHLWYDFLKHLSMNIYRQKVIGNYIVDFYISSPKIAIELDGSQHYEDKGLIDDIKRDEYLHNLGITVLRYSNYDLHRNFEGICQDILNHIRDIDPSSVSYR